MKTTTGWGADVDALHEFARFLEDHGAKFLTLRNRLKGEVDNLDWFGPDADTFRHSTGKHATDLVGLGVVCGELATILHQNADAQAATSAAESLVGFGAIGDLVVFAGQQLANSMREYLANVAIWDAAFDRDLFRLRNGSADEIGVWWASLSPAQRLYYLQSRSQELLQLQNSSPELKGLFESAYRESRADKLPVSSESLDIHAELNVKVVKLTADVGGKITEFADGHAEVELSIGGEIGATLSAKAGSGGEVSAGVGAGLKRVYKFRNRADADAFLAGLRTELTAIDGGDAWATATAGATGLVASQVIDLERYMDRFDRISNEVSGHVGADASVKFGTPGAGPSAEAKLGAEFGLRYDTDTHTTTAYRKMEASAAGSVFGVGAAASVEMETSFETGPEGTTMTLSASIEASGGLNLHAALNNIAPGTPGSEMAGLSEMAGVRASVEAKVDLKNPQVQPYVAAYIAASGTGNPALQAAALRELYRFAEVTVQVDGVVNTEATYGVEGVASVKVSGQVAQTKLIYTKPPMAGFVNMLKK